MCGEKSKNKPNDWTTERKENSSLQLKKRKDERDDRKVPTDEEEKQETEFDGWSIEESLWSLSKL